MAVFKIKYSFRGGHVYCRLFTAIQPNVTYASAGNFTVRKTEFADMQIAMSGVAFEEDGPQAPSAKLFVNPDRKPAA